MNLDATFTVTNPSFSPSELMNYVPKPLEPIQSEHHLAEELEFLAPLDSTSHNDSQILDSSQDSRLFDTTQFVGLLEPKVELGEPASVLQDPNEPVSSQFGQISPAYSNGASPSYDPEPSFGSLEMLSLTTPPYENEPQMDPNSQLDEFTQPHTDTV